MHYTTVIAEVGECFNGNMNVAHDMIRVAKEAGCDIVKFQLLDMSEVSIDDPEYDWFSQIELDVERINRLIKWGEEEGIEVLFTPVSVNTARWLVELGQKKVKIASSFVNKTDLISYINENFDTVYASTGMASLDEVYSLVAYLNRPSDIKLLHCISEYPTGPLLEERGLESLNEKDVHLEMMSILKGLFPTFSVGYSDHTDDIFAPVIATAMGADIIEKHITMDRRTPIEHYNKGLSYLGTDHVVSIEPPELMKMVQQIRRVDIMRGEREWKRSRGEEMLKGFLQGRYQERH